MDTGGILVNVTLLTAARRGVPRFGFGNELVLQSVNDSAVAAAVAHSGGTIARYPGGTPSDYWLYEAGWIRPGSPCLNSLDAARDYPKRPATPVQWRAFLDASGVPDTVLDVCQLTCTLEHQMAGLKAHEAAGTPIHLVELGNEMYDSSRQDVMAAYPQPSDYAAAMAPWVSAIQAAWPRAQVALVGVRWNAYSSAREDAWNEEVLLNSSAGAQADATTLHIYVPWGDGAGDGSDGDDIARRLAAAATYAFNNGVHVTKTVPPRMRVWVTELGVYPPGPLDGTWLLGLFYAAMALLLPQAIATLDVLLPYCLLCADPTAPAFTTAQYGPVIPPAAAGTVPVLRRPVGEAQAAVFGAVAGATAMVPLAFSPNAPLTAAEPRSRTLVGWSLERRDDASRRQGSPRIGSGGSTASAIILNQGSATQTLVGTGAALADCVHPAAPADVTRANLTADELLHSRTVATRRADGSRALELPPYSVCSLF